MNETVVPTTYQSGPGSGENQNIEVFYQGQMIVIAEETHQPNRLQIEEKVMWFDSLGSEAGTVNAKRFEEMLAKGTFKEIDNLEPNIKESVEARIRQLIYLIKKPVKFNGTWWDVNATRARQVDIVRFEKEYNNIDI